MTPLQAKQIIESLRKGIPPEGNVAEFTVGRREEIDKLQSILREARRNALLLKANIGAGKTHLLRLIRETALHMNYAVSLITLDSQSAIRFNRMDQIFGQICRQFEVPGKPYRGVRYLFDGVLHSIRRADISEKTRTAVSKLTNNGKWDYSSFLEAPFLYVALRAWKFADNGLKDKIEDWLFHPWDIRRQYLIDELIGNLCRYFRDPRSLKQFYIDEVFDLRTQKYRRSWDALNDLEKLSRLAGFRGLILLVDEFEDVIRNLNNIAYQQDAFRNLFQFFSGEKFSNLSFFAVTPDFVKKCKEVLQTKGVWGFDDSRFDKLPSFKMSPLSESQLLELGRKIVPTHFKAYSWSVSNGVVNRKLEKICREGARIPIQDRVRQTIKGIVKMLDEMMEENLE